MDKIQLLREQTKEIDGVIEISHCNRGVHFKNGKVALIYFGPDSIEVSISKPLKSILELTPNDVVHRSAYSSMAEVTDMLLQVAESD